MAFVIQMDLAINAESPINLSENYQNVKHMGFGLTPIIPIDYYVLWTGPLIEGLDK